MNRVGGLGAVRGGLRCSGGLVLVRGLVFFVRRGWGSSESEVLWAKPLCQVSVFGDRVRLVCLAIRLRYHGNGYFGPNGSLAEKLLGSGAKTWMLICASRHV